MQFASARLLGTTRALLRRAICWSDKLCQAAISIIREAQIKFNGKKAFGRVSRAAVVHKVWRDTDAS